MRNIKYKNTFERFYFNNRWKQPTYSRNGDWTVLGISVWWCSPASFRYSICLFGIEFHFWMKHEALK